MPTLDRLVDFYENLSLGDAERFAEFYTEDAFFKDPFNEVRGLEAIQRIFRHMFKQVSDPRFRIVQRIVDPQGDAVLVWEFWCRSRLLGGEQVMRGVSHLRFAADGRVSFHRDYWDASEELYAKVPLLGGLMRLLKRGLAA
ncbi:MAG TPA: nuclear transport factor 2 family protein [Fontimonas sp.]|jgi:ketosteroid isomerase-like protein